MQQDQNDQKMVSSTLEDKRRANIQGLQSAESSMKESLVSFNDTRTPVDWPKMKPFLPIKRIGRLRAGGCGATVPRLTNHSIKAGGFSKNLGGRLDGLRWATQKDGEVPYLVFPKRRLCSYRRRRPRMLPMPAEH
jgi:hypothetical protein